MNVDNTDHKDDDSKPISLSRICVCSLRTDASGVNAEATGTADLTGYWLEEEVEGRAKSAGAPVGIRALARHLQSLQNTARTERHEPSARERFRDELQHLDEMKVSATFTFTVTGSENTRVEAGLFVYAMEVEEADGATKRVYSRSGITSTHDVEVESSDGETVRASGTVTV